MKSIRNLTILLAAALVSAWAAERVVVHRVQLAGPMGTDNGHLVMVDNQLVFVDDSNPDNSFAIPRSDINNLRLENGTLTIGMSRPFTGMYGSRSDVVMRVYQPNDAGLIASWVGIPVSTAGEASRGVPAATVTTQTFLNATYRGDRGKLVIADKTVSWQDLEHPDRSRTWAYSDIRALKRDKNENAIKIDPYDGSEHKFKIEGAFMTDSVYNMIGQRIVEARPH